MPSPPPPPTTESISEDLVVLDNKIKQLKFEYDQYFMGGRPREPVMLRGDVQKIVTRYSNTGIQNTAMRFKFNNLCARYYALRRQWDAILKQIEEGTYKPHLFKAKLHERERGVDGERAPGARAARGSAETTGGGTDLFEAYCHARRECGDDPAGLTREKLDQLVAQQRAAIQKKFGCEEVRF
ncbi:MAG TPA: MXAN_5187 C-terminal domain-containing protein, partial [Myxococcota bacterium]|nr:MXAN_5187 C-terminal domain-containing protein [Myxococcota bacterium]